MDLILDVDAGEARLLEHLNRIVHIHRVAVAGIGVCGKRDRQSASQHPAMIDILGKPHNADVVDAEERIRYAGPGRGGHLEPSPFDQARTVTVVYAGGDDESAFGEEVTESLSTGLHMRPFKRLPPRPGATDRRRIDYAHPIG